MTSQPVEGAEGMYACGDGELAYDQQLAWPARSKAGGRRSGPSPGGGASRWQGQVQRIDEDHHPSRKLRLGHSGHRRLWSSPTVNPRRGPVKNPVPQAMCTVSLAA